MKTGHGSGSLGLIISQRAAYYRAWILNCISLGFDREQACPMRAKVVEDPTWRALLLQPMYRSFD
ncbi:hypothetical protein QZH41_020686, partial [Actinostola sp. cb2023]